jgi:hypothetical protein
VNSTVYILVDKHGHVRSVWANGDRAAETANAKNEEVRQPELDDRPYRVEPWAVRE